MQSNQANFNFKCRRQARFSSPPLCSYDGLTTVELVRFPGKDSTNAGLSSLLINRPPVLKSSTCCFKSRVKAPQKAEYISLCSFIHLPHSLKVEVEFYYLFIEEETRINET